MRKILFVMFMVFVGCSQLVKKPTNVVDEGIKTQQENEMKTALSRFEEQDFSDAEKKFREFLLENRLSVFSNQAKYHLARSIEAQGRFEEALTLYREVAGESLSAKPEFAGLAYFRMSYCYEAKGDEIRVISSLNDATRFGKVLTPEMNEIEIPARKAASWMRRQDFTRAKAETARLDRAFPGLFPPNNPKTLPDQGRILLSIGELSLQPLQKENFLTLIETHEKLQNYLWRAAQTGAEPYANQARQQLIGRYNKFLQVAFDLSDSSERQRVETQKKWMAAILKSLEALKNFAGEQWQTAAPELTGALAAVETKANGTLWTIRDTTPLTPEAKTRGTKRKGRVVSKPFFPNEKAQTKDTTE